MIWYRPPRATRWYCAPHVGLDFLRKICRCGTLFALPKKEGAA